MQLNEAMQANHLPQIRGKLPANAVSSSSDEPARVSHGGILINFHQVDQLLQWWEKVSKLESVSIWPVSYLH